MKAYTLLSGGIDSTTCLYIAHKEFKGNVEGISITYGQRHAKEVVFAKASCAVLGVKHRIVNLPVIPKTMLTDASVEVPNISYSEIEGVSPTYVPFRNGLMLSTIASIVHGEYTGLSADAEEEWGIYFGAHSEDAQNWAYPDCTPEFIGAMANAIYIGTYGSIRLHTPLQWDNKETIIRRGEALGVDWTKTWSCYRGLDIHCGTCPTCRARKDGFIAAGVLDPTVYSQNEEQKSHG